MLFLSPLGILVAMEVVCLGPWIWLRYTYVLVCLIIRGGICGGR